MILPIRFEPQAEAEIESSFDWYEKRSASSAEQFLNEVSEGLAMIQVHPDRFAKIGRSHRYYPLKHFPYRIIFRILPNEIAIVAVAHNSRRPNYWRT